MSDAVTRSKAELIAELEALRCRIPQLEQQAEELNRARELQVALFEISELSHVAENMDEFYRRIHQITCNLMYAENFIIGIVHPHTGNIRFEYFRDSVDADVDVDQLNSRSQKDLRGSLTAQVINSNNIVHVDPVRNKPPGNENGQNWQGADSVDWLGVPLPGPDGAIGALVVQSYNPEIKYDRRDEHLLGFVCQHVATALQRKWAGEALVHARDELEIRVRERTTELENEIKIRRRGEQVEAALFRIARLVGDQIDIEAFYAAIHEVVSELVYAKNMFIAFVDEDAGLIRYPFIIDEVEAPWGDEPIPENPAKTPGLTLQVVYSGEPILYRDSRASTPAGSVGAPSVAWLGVPLKAEQKTIGALVVQSHDPEQGYDEQDKELLTFVAGHLSTTIQRRQDKLALQQAHTDLELRVAERTAELNQSNTELRATLGKLETAQTHLVESEKMASLGNLVAGIAHEINTPLGVAVTAASHLESRVSSLARSDSDNQELLQFAQRAQEVTGLLLSNLRRAAQLVASFKQVAADQSTRDRRKFNVREYVQEILTSLQPKIRRSGHQVELHCEQDIVVDGYPSALYQIISNLVMNSLIHAFDADTVGLIRIEIIPGKDDFKLIYKDNGRGLKADEQQHIFEPFYTTRRGEGGTGLGMHITYNNVTQLGGSIDFEGQAGAGVTFSITLPRVAREIPQAQFIGQV